MKRIGLVILLIAVFSCGNNKNTPSQEEEAEPSFNYESFSKRYAVAALPYQLSDSDLLKNKDTSRLSASLFESFVADSLKKKLFGKTTGVRYIPLQKIENKKGESYFITKAVSSSKTIGLLTVFAADRTTAVSFPFLVPDDDVHTTQTTTIDNAFSISRNIMRKGTDNVTVEGKEVYSYNAAANSFTLIMTDVLDEKSQELINPIDTLSRRHKFSGDYVKDKKNIVSIRDGRTPAELLVFIHFENADEEDCTGELKGTLFFTSTTTAVYRQGGDPCVLEFKFTTSSVTLHEEEGCGSHRGLKCLFDGTFPRKEASKSKGSKKKAVKK